MPVIAPPVDDDVLPPLEQFASTPTDTVLTSFLSVCPSSEPEKINHENDFQNEMKLKKLDGQILQLLDEVTFSYFSKACCMLIEEKVVKNI
jgi:leucine-rich repeat/coiled-coil domain-containing protein 1